MRPGYVSIASISWSSIPPCCTMHISICHLDGIGTNVFQKLWTDVTGEYLFKASIEALQAAWRYWYWLSYLDSITTYDNQEIRLLVKSGLTRSRNSSWLQVKLQAVQNITLNARDMIVHFDQLRYSKGSICDDYWRLPTSICSRLIVRHWPQLVFNSHRPYLCEPIYALCLLYVKRCKIWQVSRWYGH